MTHHSSPVGAQSARLVVALPEKLRPGFHEAVCAVSPQIDLALVSNDGPLPRQVARAAVFYRSLALRREVVDAVLERAGDLRWMHVPAAGVEAALTPNVLSRQFTITNVAGLYDVAVAELALGLILAAAKRLPTYFAGQREGRWLRPASWDEVQQEPLLPQLLRGKTAAIVGFGGTGGTLAGILRPLGMRVLGMRREPRPDPRADAMYGPDGLPDVLAEADYVVLTLPLTPATEGVIGAKELGHMMPTAWLINVARGRLVDDEALVGALEAGRIAGACLDVFSQEPLPEAHPYYRLPNVIMTPHIAGAFPGLDAVDRDYFIDLLRRFMAGEPLPSVVDRNRGY